MTMQGSKKRNQYQAADFQPGGMYEIETRDQRGDGATFFRVKVLDTSEQCVTLLYTRTVERHSSKHQPINLSHAEQLKTVTIPVPLADVVAARRYLA